MATWLERLEQDATHVLDLMSSAQRSGRVSPWRIGEICNHFKHPPARMARDRIYGAIAHLVDTGRVAIEGDRLDNSKFYPTGP